MFMKARLTFLLLALSLVTPAQQRNREFERPARHSARGTHGAVAGGSDYAVDADLRMYYRGGNAVDAGVATTFAASVCEFSHFGFGGEATILIRTRDGKVHAIAGVGTMPKLATADFFRQRRLQPGEIMSAPEKGGLRGMVPVAGLMPALVPGMVDAELVALREYGTKSFSEAIAPAIDLADGMGIDETRAGAIERNVRFFELWPSSMRVFLPGDHVPMPGEISRQPDLARTLRSMADVEKKTLASGANRTAAIDAVRDFFYRGEIALRIDTFMRAN